MVRKLEKRFAPPLVPGQAPIKGISFDRFLLACVTVKHFTESFRRYVGIFFLGYFVGERGIWVGILRGCGCVVK